MPLPNSTIRSTMEMDERGAYRRPGGGTTYQAISPGEQYRSGTLGNILNNYFVPEYLRTQAQLPGAEQLLLERIKSPMDFSAFRGELTAMTQGIAKDLFRPGGQVDLAGRAALGESVGSGFGPTSGGYTQARQNILQGARDYIGNAMAQGAIQLAPTAVQSRANEISNAMGLAGFQAGRADDLRESLFGARGSIEQLNLAKRQMAMNEMAIKRAYGMTGGQRAGGAIRGALGGMAMAGAGLIPGGALVGGILGGLGGLFG